MLRALNIRNFALVAELDIEFAAGLTVITGESGAGKSILLDALGLVLGARVKRSQLRPGFDACEVSAEFNLADAAASLETLARLELLVDGEEATCLVRRTANEQRSRAFVNGTPTTLAVLQSLTEPLIDVHGQHEHRQLTSRPAQRRLLDEFGVAPALIKETAESYRQREALASELAERRQQAERMRERESLLRYQVDELAALGDIVQRVDELTATHKRLHRAQELTAAIGQATVELEDDLLGRVGGLTSTLAGLDDPHPNLLAAAELAASAQACLDEALGELRSYMQSFSNDDGELGEVEEALAALHDVARKHRVAAPELATRLRCLSEELESLSALDASVDQLQERAAAAEAGYRDVAKRLSTARRRAAKTFSESVTATLRELGMAGASVGVAFAPSESAAGLETVDFQAVTNSRFGAASLGDIASGGELSRISLAIQVVTAESSRLPCLILDEADVGVGGTSADVLGRMLRRLSAHTQVIAITHAPQIAALGDQHLVVAKNSEQDVGIRALDGSERTEELARMLGGRKVTADTRAYARALLAEGAGASARQ